MSKKVKITITVDDALFKSFKGVLPDYVSVSGILETFIKEYMAGYYRFEWSLSEMIDVLRGKTTVSYLQGVHDYSLRGLPADEIKTRLEDAAMIEFSDPNPRKPSIAEKSKSKSKTRKKE